MLRFLAMTMLCSVAFLAACGGSAPAPSAAPVESKTSAPAVPPEIQQVAESVLGADTDVLVFGDLAGTGRQQALFVNRLKTTPENTVPGILITRAVVVEKDGSAWKEVLRCDEHLRNPSGYLAATPLAAVGGWRLQYEQQPEKGLAMYFTPLQQPAGGYKETIGVRWNPKLKRYQSLDRNFQEFLGETPALETPTARLSQ
jgi:hypothetical protein